jgi:hypothetical protein
MYRTFLHDGKFDFQTTTNQHFSRYYRAFSVRKKVFSSFLCVRTYVVRRKKGTRSPLRLHCRFFPEYGKSAESGLRQHFETRCVLYARRKTFESLSTACTVKASNFGPHVKFGLFPEGACYHLKAFLQKQYIKQKL